MAAEHPASPFGHAELLLSPRSSGGGPSLPATGDLSGSGGGGPAVGAAAGLAFAQVGAGGINLNIKHCLSLKESMVQA
jgi:hypothetical protein